MDGSQFKPVGSPRPSGPAQPNQPPITSPLAVFPKSQVSSPRENSGFPFSAQWVLAILLALLFLLIAIRSHIFLRTEPQPTELIRGEGIIYRVDVNKADQAELMQLPGIGPKTAKKIVDYRVKNGQFGKLSELENVSGIGPKTVNRLRPWIRLDGFEDDSSFPSPSKQSDPSKVFWKKEKPSEPTEAGFPLDINTATATELDRLPRIGPILAQRIIEEREKRLFLTIADLQRVKGIGPKTVEHVRPFVIVSH